MRISFPVKPASVYWFDSSRITAEPIRPLLPVTIKYYILGPPESSRYPSLAIRGPRTNRSFPEPLPLAGLHLEPLVHLIGPANRAVASYNGVLYALPNPDILLSPLATQEAALSSRIEGAQATLGDVLKFEAGEEPAEQSKKSDIQEILNYRRALWRAQAELERRPFNLNLLLELHSVLLDNVRGVNRGRGHFRRVQNWIGAPGSEIGQADFIPPAPARLPELLDNWEKYYHCDQPDLLVQLAIVHAQFEIIHPFVDGNGRLGRILIPLFLFERGTLSRPVFYLSAYIEAHKDEYVFRLRALGAGAEAWGNWIEFFLRAVTTQAEANLKTAREISALYDRLKHRVIEITQSKHAVPLLDAIFTRPIFSSSEFDGRNGMPSRQTIIALLSKLKETGILTTLAPARGRRPQILALPELMNLVEGREVFPPRTPAPNAG